MSVEKSVYRTGPRDRPAFVEKVVLQKSDGMVNNAAYPKAIAALKASGTLPESVELRQVKYLNNLIEQDHRFICRN
jgi:transposase-like protein